MKILSFKDREFVNGYVRTFYFFKIPYKQKRIVTRVIRSEDYIKAMRNLLEKELIALKVNA